MGQFSTWPLLLQAMLLNASWESAHKKLDGPAPFEWRMWSPYFPIQFIFQFDWAQNSFPLRTEQSSSSFFCWFFHAYFVSAFLRPVGSIKFSKLSLNMIYFLSCSLNKIWVYVICWCCFYIHFTQHPNFFRVGFEWKKGRNGKIFLYFSFSLKKKNVRNQWQFKTHNF